ncbi:IS481 family transposase [Streptomyces sp. AV19]|uniref:IS481 family transposase n=1 Tax=Streptomyces sp. AV19 TaxID=2793068 RepID=UPI0018FE53EF|nr:IS481 family transposase [Streptomyces sp. AV19]MBH1934531.1 IS481 family transposase [Streptomyces sp. AV19]MDG4536945.1 IS481 family transposase [Streptomyces sp. AV19]
MGSDRAWLAEQRFQAVREVQAGSPVTEVAVRYGVSRQTVHNWRRRYEADGIAGLDEVSRRPHRSPHRVAAEVEAEICELRRAHPRWGARRISFELGERGVEPVPSKATVHRVLTRNSLVVPQEQRHVRKYKRWQREAPMHLWQMDLVGGIFLADGRECKMLTGIDDHSRFLVVSAVLAVPSGRAVCEAFAAAMRRYGIPSEVLTDNGKQFTGRFTKPRPAEVLFERVCRENGITARLTKPRSPTTTGKIERFHATLRRELLDGAGPFADLPAAQEAIDAWVHAYNHKRPHQALNMATPGSLFRPARPQPGDPAPAPDSPAVPQVRATAPAESAPAAPLAAEVVLPFSQNAVEFDTVIAASGVLSVLPRTQRLRIAAKYAGHAAHVWADEFSVHVQIGGEHIRTAASNLTVADLEELRLRGARPAGPPPVAVTAARGKKLAAGAVVELTRAVGGDGFCQLGGQALKVGTPLARRQVTLRLDGHLVHVVADGVLAKTLPSPLAPDERASLRGARIATDPLPAPAPGPISVTRRVPRDGVVMVTRQRLRIGRTHAGKTVHILVEDTHFRVLLDGEELCLHPRDDKQPVTRFRAYAARTSTNEVSTKS